MQLRKGIEVSGIVQGVGFRPYVYRLATTCGLTGSIANTPAGVSIEIQGSAQAVTEFVARLVEEAPPLARITDVAVRDLPCDGDATFRILPSRAAAQRDTLISPDVALCADCMRELFDPTDRRYLYPFINCTNCGPRFTIVRGIPYDRPRTSMAAFPMCAACQAEYDNPASRRFHAQPNACWDCGPHVELWDARGRRLTAPDAIAAAALQLAGGAIVAVKGLGGFHLAADALNSAAVEKLRRCKRRVEKPFAVMVPDLETVERFCVVDEGSRELLLRPERPIVLLPRLAPGDAAHGPDDHIADPVAPFNRYLGAFLPYTPLHHLLFAAGGFRALVMTSGNLSEEPIAIANQEALERLTGLADFFLVHNRDILCRADDSVVRAVPRTPRPGREGSRTLQMLRRSRGFVPVPIFLHKQLSSILAVGGELKSTLCLTRGRHAFLSQHIGDLENLESYRFFEEATAHLGHILEIEPGIIAHDLHPDYFSTRWALAQKGRERIGVQHHHAHIASCMAENHLDGRVIGFALDGTGYGTDGRVWGGEVLLADYSSFERAAHLAYVPMPGGAAAIHEPWRMAVSYLAHHFGREFLNFPIAFAKHLDRSRLKILLGMMEGGVNAPLTSSCGRLFDAVAALIGIRLDVNYEAQAAIELEMVLAESVEDDSAYPLVVETSETPWPINTRPLFEALVADLKNGLPPGVMSRRFHNGLIAVFARIASLLRDRTGLNRVCLSGGSFQNVYLLEHLQARLAAAQFDVYTHHEVPPGDGGLSLGQAAVAAHRAILSTSRVADQMP